MACSPYYSLPRKAFSNIGNMSSGDSKKQRKPFYKSDNGWSSRGGGGGGGRGGGGRGGRGGNGSAGGPSRLGENGRMSNPMGIYRETPAVC